MIVKANAEQFGPLEIHLTRESQKTHVVILARSEHVRAMLERHLEGFLPEGQERHNFELVIRSDDEPERRHKRQEHGERHTPMAPEKDERDRSAEHGRRGAHYETVV